MQSEADTLKAFRREFLWRFSKYILHEHDLEWAGQHLVELRKLSVEPMLPLLRYVWNDLLDNVRCLTQAYPVLLPLDQAIAFYCQPHQEINAKTIEAQNELLMTLAADNLWPLVVKGAAMRAYTMQPQAMTDTDVIAYDLDEAWAVVRVAEQLGYPLSKIKLRQAGSGVPDSVRYHGYANLYRREGGGAYIQGDWDLGRVRTLDLHVARFHGVGEGVLLTNLWQRAQRRQLGIAEAVVPCSEDMILVELLHLLRHGTLAMRGINRICHLLTMDSSLDADYLCAEIRRNDLVLIGHAVFRAIVQTFPHAQPVVASLRTSLGPAPLWARPLVRRVAALRRVERYGAGTITSVGLQTHYLYNSFRHQLGHTSPFVRSIVGFGRMFRYRKVYPRAHKRWRERRQGWISARNPEIMLTRLDTQPWQPSGGWEALKQLRILAGRNVIVVSRTSLLVNAGRRSEILVTPLGSFTTANYDGHLSVAETKLCLAFAQSIRQEL